MNYILCQSNPAALVIDKQYSPIEHFIFTAMGPSGEWVTVEGGKLHAVQNTYVKQWACALYTLSLLSSRMTLWIQISKLRHIL